MSLSVWDARSANRSTGAYLTRSFNVEPPERRMMPGAPVYRDYSERLRLGKDCDEVFPGIIIGDGPTAKNIDYLNKLGVTHVVNTAENDVTLNPKKLSKAGIAYMGFRCADLPNADIAQHFEATSAFIDRAMSFSGGLVFVNCLLGLSRSATIVAAYLMKHKGMSASQAITTMRSMREVKPNIGFLQQLGELDDKLRKDRYRKYYH